MNIFRKFKKIYIFYATEIKKKIYDSFKSLILHSDERLTL